MKAKNAMGGVHTYDWRVTAGKSRRQAIIAADPDAWLNETKQWRVMACRVGGEISSVCQWARSSFASQTARSWPCRKSGSAKPTWTGSKSEPRIGQRQTDQCPRARGARSHESTSAITAALMCWGRSAQTSETRARSASSAVDSPAAWGWSGNSLAP